MMISIIMNFNVKNSKIPKEIYILSETSKWHKKEITNDKHKNQQYVETKQYT